MGGPNQSPLKLTKHVRCLLNDCFVQGFHHHSTLQKLVSIACKHESSISNFAIKTNMKFFGRSKPMDEILSLRCPCIVY